MRRFAVFGAVLVVLAALYVAAWGTQPGRPGAKAAAAAPAGRPVAVTSVSRTCPPPGPDTGEAHIAVIAMPSLKAGSAAAADPAGQAALAAIPFASAGQGASGAGTPAGPGASRVTVTSPGTLTLATAPAPAQYGGTALAATGTMAEGFEAEQTTASGMGTVSCTRPGADMWFVGTGQQAGAPVTRLYLMNTGAQTASVEVTMLTDAGQQQGLKNAITVGPHQYLWENIAQFTRGSVVIALHVQTSSGQIAAAVWQGPSGGPGGTWLPQAAAPSANLVIPGLTAASSAARLFVAVPGTTDAQVKVVALTAQGKILPFGSSPLAAPSGAASSFALSSLGTSAAALVLTSNVPVTAGVAVGGSGAGAFTAAAAPVTEQGVVAGNPAGAGLTVGLILTAPAGAGAVGITVVGSNSDPERTRQTPQTATKVVQIPAGRTVAVPVQPPPGAGHPFAIVVTPRARSGPIYAARVVTSGGMGLSGSVMSVLPVASALTQITLAPTRDSYSAVIP